MLVMAVRSAVSSVQLKAWALGHERFILDGSMPCSPPGLLVISSALNISGNFISSDWPHRSDRDGGRSFGFAD